MESTKKSVLKETISQKPALCCGLILACIFISSLMSSCRERGDDESKLSSPDGASIGSREIIDSKLHQALKKGDQKAAKNYLSENRHQVNAVDDLGQTPLHYAAHGKMPSLAEQLISMGADVDAKESTYGETPLHLAVISSPEVAKILISAGANVNAKKRGGKTPLHICLARRRCELGLLRALIEKGASADEKDFQGKTPTDYARERGHVEALELIGELSEND